MGVALSTFSEVPPLARRCLDFLEVDGVFRIENFSMQTPSVTEVLRLTKQFEDTDPDSLVMAFESPETVCGVLRKWLRTLPEPLFGYEFYDQWVALQHHQVTEDLFGEIQTVMFQLHPTHYAVMQRVFRFLHKLASYGAVNRVTPALLGFNWQPCLIWSQANALAIDPMRVSPDGGLAGSIVATMIEHYDKLFVEETTWVPPEFDLSALPPQTPVAQPSTTTTPPAIPTNGSSVAGYTSLTGSTSSLPPLSGSPGPNANNGGPEVSHSSASLSRSEEEDSSPPLSANQGTGTPADSAAPIGTALGASSQPLRQSAFAAASFSTPQGSPSTPHALGGPSPSSSAPSSGHLGAPPSITIPPTTIHGQPASNPTANSVPVTPITPLPSAAPTQPLARSFAGTHSTSSGNLNAQQANHAGPPTSLTRTNSQSRTSEDGASPRASTSFSSSPVTVPRKKQPIIVNGYSQATTLCDFTDMTDGMLQFFKNEHIYITNKHDDGWWEGWKRGRRGFFPAQYVVEIAI